MTTSGSTNFNPTANLIIQDAALDLLAIDAYNTMPSEMSTRFYRSLNLLVKHYAAQGLHLWTESEAVLFPAASTPSYTLGTSGTARCPASYHSTTISADEAIGQTTLSIETNASMTDGDNIGIILDDGTLQWSTISSSTSTTVTIADALTDSAAYQNAVFFYTTSIGRPLRITSARRYNITGATDTPINLISRQEYHDLPLKTQTGYINEMFYDPQLGTGTIYLWEPPDTIEDLVKFTYWRQIEDFDSAGDTADFPQEWILALRYNLAKTMLPRYPNADKALIAGMAAQYLSEVSAFDREPESVMFAPDLQGHGF